MKRSGSAETEWRQYYSVVVAATAGVAISTINAYSTGLFIEPFEHAFGWTRGQITLGPAIASFTTVLVAPFVGHAIDRFGPRRLGIFGTVSLVVLTSLLGFSGPSIWSWWAAWTLLAVITVFIQPVIWTSGVSSFFTAGRGLALAVTLCGSGIGSLITPVLAYRLIAHGGWQYAFVGLAASWGVVALPLILLFFTSAKDSERVNERLIYEQSLRTTRSDPRLLLSRKFVQLAVAGFLIATVVVSAAVSLVPILSWSGFERSKAAGIASLLGFASIFGRLTIGSLLDRFEGRYLAALSVCLPILSSWLLISAPTSISAATSAVLIFGLALGAELDLVAYLTSRYFRLENFGLLFGTIAGLITLAGGGGPWVISLIYDAKHSYLPALWAITPMCLVSSLLFLLLGPSPPLVQRTITGKAAS